MTNVLKYKNIKKFFVKLMLEFFSEILSYMFPFFLSYFITSPLTSSKLVHLLISLVLVNILKYIITTILKKYFSNIDICNNYAIKLDCFEKMVKSKDSKRSSGEIERIIKEYF